MSERKTVYTFYNKKTGEAEGIITAIAPKGISVTVCDDCWIGSECRLSIVVLNSVVSLRLSGVHIYGKSALNIKIGN